MAKNHYSPIFANKRWTNETHDHKFKRFYFCDQRKEIIEARRNVGKKGWGYEHDLYSESLEKQLDLELENPAELIYEKLIKNKILSTEERMKWGQFIVTQAIRTPSFFRYRDFIESQVGGDHSYKETIIGCTACPENKQIASRNWLILLAHEDDFFVRTDNPVYMTGFLEISSTTVFYPLSPKHCFVACSTLDAIPVIKGEKPPYPKQETLQLEKGDAYTINFELIKSAYKEVILSISDNNSLISLMNLEMLGVYPQIPYLMFNVKNIEEAYQEADRLIEIMSIVDGIQYPEREYPFEYFYGVEFSAGINPFSIFEVTNNQLTKLVDEQISEERCGGIDRLDTEVYPMKP